MNLREVIEAYANAVSIRDYYDDRGAAQRADAAAKTLHQRRQDLDALLAVAEAAIAIVEQQEAVDNYAFADAVMGRGELWEQYKAAKAKAKDANQS